MTTTDWKALADECIAYGRVKGFEPTTWHDLPTRLMCMSSECRELEDALSEWSTRRYFRGHPLLAPRRECADIVMYGLSIMADLGTPNWNLRGSFHGGASRLSSPSEIVRPVRKCVDNAFRAWRMDSRKDALVCVELAIVAVVDLHRRVLGISAGVESSVREKIASSACRPRTHGKSPRS